MRNFIETLFKSMLSLSPDVQPRYTLRCRNRILTMDRPLVMGILNVTPDSFYEGSRFPDADLALQRAEQIMGEGGDIIDIGAVSSRPGSATIPAEEELNRIIPVLRAIRKRFPDAILSVDTYRPAVASVAIQDCGADMINDISGGDWEPGMFELVSRLHVPYIVMHTKGTPDVMQNNPSYESLFTEILDYFALRIRKLRESGHADIIIDPGFGFGKTLEHNYRLLAGLENFRMLGCPILVGVSRKSMIQKLLQIDAGAAMNGSIVLQTVAMLKGAAIIRTHDVKETSESVRLLQALSKH